MVFIYYEIEMKNQIIYETENHVTKLNQEKTFKKFLRDV